MLGVCDDCFIKFFLIKIIKDINNIIIIIFKVRIFILRLFKCWFLMGLILFFWENIFCLLLEELVNFKLDKEFNFKFNVWF